MFWLLHSVFVYLCTLLSASSDTLTVYQCCGYSVSLPVGLDFGLVMEVHTEGLRSSPVSLGDGMQQECDWERKHGGGARLSSVLITLSAEPVRHQNVLLLCCSKTPLLLLLSSGRVGNTPTKCGCTTCYILWMEAALPRSYGQTT